MKGIDVSVHNGTVDWQAVKEAGCEFTIIRLGYGNRHLDGSFADNVTGRSGGRAKNWCILLQLRP